MIKKISCPKGRLTRKIRQILPANLIMLGLLMAACASIGNPSGGPRDEEPPKFVRATPAPGSVNVSRDRIDIEFNEIVNVKDAFTNVVVSPISKSVPRVSSLGRRISVQFTDTLLPNTTYTIDFGNSIEDNNESNKLQGFTYTFSTGPELDSLQISGMVLGAQDLEPQQGMLVGVYSNLSDTAFATLPLERIAKTDDRGRFSIKGLSAGNYRIYALADQDNDYKRANPEEAMAFYDFTLSPSAERITASDSVRDLRTGQLDTVLTRERTRFLPNDILLRSFVSDFKPQYLQNYERVDSTRIKFIFNAPSDSLPQLEVVGKETPENWWVLEKSEKNDTLIYWMLPHELIATDSLRIAATYLRPDSTQRLVAGTDTLRFFMPRAKAAKKVEKKDEKREKKEQENDSITPKPTPLGFKVTSSFAQEVYLPLFMEFDTPLTSLDTTAFHLDIMIDSVWKPVPHEWRPQPVNNSNPRKFMIEYPWAYGTEYRLTVDTLAATGIYGLQTDPLEHKFTVKTEDDYSAITFDITNFTDTVPAFVELLNTSDSPVRRAPVVNGKAVLKYLEPGKYYARIFEDFNGNGVFDTGIYDSIAHVQPDLAYYYPKMITIKKNWEKQESWDVFSIPIDMMKPEAIKKNKPEQDKRSRNRNTNNQEEEEEEDYFDPTRNPFDPNDRGARRNTRY